MPILTATSSSNARGSRPPTNIVKPLHYIVNALDIPANQAQPNVFSETLYHKLTAIPRPVEVVYLTEINETWARGKGYVNWNLWNPATTTFNMQKQANPVSSARMMHANEKRHSGIVNLLFFDSHVEGRKLNPARCAILALQPLFPQAIENESSP